MEFFIHQFNNNNNNNNNNKNGESQLPPGFRFHPTDEELITCYLLHKVLDANFTCRAIADVDLNKCEPWDLPQRAKMGEKEWYFFSLRDRKYPTGLRTNRATKAGYWKATGKDREIYSSKTSALVGMKKTLVFYRGRAPKGEKSNWVMHEYRLEGKFAYHFLTKSSKDEQVICRVFQKSSSGGTGVSGTKRVASGMDSPYASATSAYTGDHDTYSYDSNAASTEHVPCFSTASVTNFNPQPIFNLPPLSPLSAPTFAPMGYPKNVGMSSFPSLRALEENLQHPLFYPAVAPSQPPIHGDGVMCSYGNVSSGDGMPDMVSPVMEKPKAGLTELDCIWSF